MQQDEVKAVTIIKRYLSVLKEALKRYNGKLLNDYGDGSLCAFSSVVDAVNCAKEVQHQLQQNTAVPLRIGLHIGEIFFEDKKVLGDGVNVASRVQSLATGNSILLSKEVYEKIKNRTEFKTVSLGSFEFKNVDEPIEVFALCDEGLIVPKREQMEGKLKKINTSKNNIKKYILSVAVVVFALIAVFIYNKFSSDKTLSNSTKSIAILPFKNISTNKEENEPFCVGVALELQKKLELFGGLIPIASQSVERYRDTKLSIPDIAKELGGIKYIVQGNVLRDKNKVEVFVSLTDATTDREIWSDDFPGEVKDIFSLQENIAQQIASALQVKITPDEESRINRLATQNPAAIDAYNDALTAYVKLVSTVHPMYWDSLTSSQQLYSAYLHTLALCDKTIQSDPLMAEAYVLKGQTYVYGIYDWTNSESENQLAFDSIRSLAKRALLIDGSSSDAYLLLSKCIDDSAEFYIKKSLTINPNNFDANRELGLHYIDSNPEKAIALFKKAIRLNPLSVFTPSVYSRLGYTYHNFGDFQAAELYCKKAVELADTNTMAWRNALRTLTIIYNHWGKADSVIKYANLYVKEEPNALYDIAEAYCNIKNNCGKAAKMYDTLWHRYPNRGDYNRWAVALFYGGRIEEAKEKIKLAEKWYKDRNDTLDYNYAGVCVLKGDKETALKILRQWRWDWGSPYLIQHDKLFDNIRNDKEFKQLVQKALDEKTKERNRIKQLEEKGEL
jgi:TolB-like protein/Flp pilus assembly protein TadD